MLLRPSHLRVPSNLLDPRIAIGLVLLTMGVGTVGYRLLEDYTWIDAFYMAVITASTVGYGEAGGELSQTGRLFTAAYIIVNVGTFAYSLAVFSYFVVQGELFKRIHTNMVNLRIDQLQDHVILCGFGKYGEEVAGHLLEQEIPLIIIDRNPDVIEYIQKSDKKLLYLEGDATDEDVLIAARLTEARSLVTVLPDDAENTFVALTAREIDNRVKIISRVSDPRSASKLKLAGASHTIMPDQIGGFYMATLVSKPNAIEFFSFLTSEYAGDIGFEEISYAQLPADMRTQPIQDWALRRSTGVNIIGHRSASGKYIVNPAPDTKLREGGSFILLGNQEQLTAMRQYLDEIR